MPDRASPSRGRRQQTKIFAHPLVFLAVIVLVVFGFARDYYADGRLPLRDFGGASAWLWKVTRWFDGSDNFSLWVKDFFCGQPWTLIFPTLFWFIMYAPFALLWGPVVGLKIGIVFYLALAGFTMFLFARRFLRSVPAAWIAGLAYALHPIHIDLSVRWGLTNFPVFYPFVPLLALLLIKLARSPSARLSAAVGVVAALAFWADFQRAFVTYPFLAILFLFEVYRARNGKPSEPSSWRHPVAWAVLSVALMVGLLAFVLVGPLVEQKHLSLFSPEEIARQQVSSSLANPLYPFDRDGILTSGFVPLMGPGVPDNAGTYYFGGAALIAGVLALLVARRDPRRSLIVFSLLLGLAAYWLSFGVKSVYETCGYFIGGVVNDPLVALVFPWFVRTLFLVVLLSVTAILFFVARRRQRISESWILIACLTGTIFLFGRPFVWLTRWVPFYGNMRSPTWFASVIPAFAAAIVLGAGVAVLSDRFKKPQHRWLFLGIALLLLFVDTYPYFVDIWPHHSRFDLDAMRSREYRPAPPPPDDEASSLHDIGEWFSTQGKPGRWIAADPYSPLTDALITYCGRPSAWAWLNWSSVKGLGRYFGGPDGVYVNLMDADRIGNALVLLGIADVRYIVVSPRHMVNRAVLSEQSLKTVYASGSWRVLENPAWRPYIQFYARQESQVAEPTVRDRSPVPEVPVENPHIQDGLISFDVDLQSDCLAVVSESWYPYWQATVDGRSVKPRAAEGAFLCIDLPSGQHQVEFRYVTPRHTKVGLAVTLAAVIAVGLIFLVGGARPH